MSRIGEASIPDILILKITRELIDILILTIYIRTVVTVVRSSEYSLYYNTCNYYVRIRSQPSCWSFNSRQHSTTRSDYT